MTILCQATEEYFHAAVSLFCDAVWRKIFYLQIKPSGVMVLFFLLLLLPFITGSEVHMLISFKYLSTDPVQQAKPVCLSPHR